MTYDEARGQIRSGDLIALTHRRYASWYDLKVMAVRYGCASEYCHVAEALVFGGRVWVVESVTPLVRLVPLSLLAEEGFFWAPLGVDVSEAELEFMMARVGKGRYSVAQAVLARLRRLKIGNDELWECAEFVLVARRLSGLDLGDEATPAEVMRAAQLHGGPTYFIKK